ncbi:DUF3261 domain-containing protein [uncultured Methylophaga sp.]|uniref:DUF3261 domain-containing protein n=1 Tax=uncultured Methylophaga sp. TaxID=285271 RepID=UPI002611BB07|nr:DUF3261 domain-containing protein [uncultured Methylophaga sp.]
MRFFVIGLLILPWLAGCSLLSKSLMPDNVLLLMSPDPAMEQGVSQRKVTLVRKAESQRFVVITENTTDITQVAVLTPAGQRVLSMKYDGREFESTNYTGMPLPDKDIFAMMQFAVWPESALKDVYNSHDGWRMVLSSDQRQLFKQQQPILKVLFKPNQTDVHHLRHQYQVIIEPLENHQ